MQKLLKWLKAHEAKIERFDEDVYEVSGTINDKRFSVSGFAPVRGSSNKVVGYIAWIGKERNNHCLSQQSVIGFIESKL